MPVQEVNAKTIIIKKTPRYYHCFKLSDSEYVLFDNLMDIPICRGSIEIMQGVKLPQGAIVWYYKTVTQKAVSFQLTPEKTIDVSGGETLRTKPPKKIKGVEPSVFVYHHFRLSPTLSALYDMWLDVPVAYGDNQKIDRVKREFGDTISIITYKESLRIKNSFSVYHIKLGKAT